MTLTWVNGRNLHKQNFCGKTQDQSRAESKVRMANWLSFRWRLNEAKMHKAMHYALNMLKKIAVTQLFYSKCV